MKKIGFSILIVLSLVLLLSNSVYAAPPNSKPKTIDVYVGQSIQKAVSNANAGDTIVVHAGTYLTDSYNGEITVTKPLTLQGLGAVIETPGEYGFSIQAACEVSGFKIRPSAVPLEGLEPRGGIFFVGGTPHPYTGGSAHDNEILPGFTVEGIGVAGENGITIQNNKISASPDIMGFDGIGAGGSDITIIGNDIVATGNGISLGEGSGFTVSNNKITIGGLDNRYGVNFNNGAKVAITNNTFKVNPTPEGSYNGGVWVNATDRVTVRNNVITGGSGISVFSSSDVEISNNNVTTTSLQGFTGMNLNSNKGSVVVRNNNINAAYFGIYFASQNVGVVSNNTIKMANVLGTIGITFDYSSNCVASNNAIYGGTLGIRTGAACPGSPGSNSVTLINNTLVSQYNAANWVGVTGIYCMVTTNSLITSNSITGYAQGITVEGYGDEYPYNPSFGNTVSKNTLKSTNGWYGIYFGVFTKDNIAKNNTISVFNAPYTDVSGLNTP